MYVHNVKMTLFLLYTAINSGTSPVYGSCTSCNSSSNASTDCASSASWTSGGVDFLGDFSMIAFNSMIFSLLDPAVPRNISAGVTGCI